MTARPALSCLLLCLFTVPAAAQERSGLPPLAGEYRRDMPDVNARPYESAPDSSQQRIFADFGSWSERASRPKMLLFWNRQLTDDTTTRYRDRERGAEALAVGPGLVVSAYDRVREQERTTGGAYAHLHPDDEGELESAFLSAFLRTGANLVDRASLMRKVSTGATIEDRADTQFMEAVAIEQGVDYLIEILPEYRGDTPTGMMFSVKITHLPTSQVRAQFRTDARPAPGPERLIAAPGGFQRSRDERLSNANIAETLAADTMMHFLN